MGAPNNRIKSDARNLAPLMRPVRQQELPDISTLASILAVEGAGRGLTLAHDTHYDANNLELLWWQGRICHRIDVQPMLSGEVAVTHDRDHDPLRPTRLCWLPHDVPLFPVVARVECESVGAVAAPFEAASLRRLLKAVLPHNNSLQPDAVSRRRLIPALASQGRRRRRCESHPQHNEEDVW
jgi:hypothetical protein